MTAAQTEGGAGGLLGERAIVLTGASRGLGNAVARALAEQGASLVINARDGERLEALAAELSGLGGRVIAVAGSVAEEALAAELVSRCVEEFGRIDVLINNAGVVRDRTTLRMSAEEFDDVIAVNLRGTWLCGREAARAMRDGGGHLINVISNVAFHGSIGQSNYAASKSGAAALTRAWAYELGRYGIRSNALWPIALTDMTQVVVERAEQIAEQQGQPAPSAATIGLGDPAEVAKVLVYLSSDLAADINGQILTFNGGRLALWTHPQEVEVRERESWTVEQIAEVFSGPGAAAQQSMYEPALKPLPGA
ncbi:MAG TPA: SDR family NAD(P)-dependent oxidoreductase [Solirubrobacteraceae bacterium]|jgi:3-oxoacyl-[acyl-carrier protein] reductase|nr:SDR family NAD(P)-dependent oxidoreductase [Solirubrobacteraceae bacterium]